MGEAKRQPTERRSTTLEVSVAGWLAVNATTLARFSTRALCARGASVRGHVGGSFIPYWEEHDPDQIPGASGTTPEESDTRFEKPLRIIIGTILPQGIHNNGRMQSWRRDCQTLVAAANTHC